MKLSYLLDYTFFKTNVSYYGLTTILFHIVNVFLVYLLINRLTRKTHIAVFTAICYGTSPLYSETTIWAASRLDSLLVIFMMGVLLLYSKDDIEHPNLPWSRHIVVIVLTLLAAGSKETWVLLPFFVLSLLWIAKQVPFKTALKSTLSLWLLLIIYMGYFVAFPMLTGSASPTSYADLNIGKAVQKFGYILFKFSGLGDSFSGAVWQYVLLFACLGGFTYWFIRDKNRPALLGLVWLFMSIGISLPISYAPSRYNYLPLVGFWLMVIAFLSREIGRLLKRPKIKSALVYMVVGVIFVLYIAYQVIMVQWEIKDYREQGNPHKTLVEMYASVKDQLPRNEPIIFADLSTRKAVWESHNAVKGYPKLLFVRETAIWQLVYLSPLANFAGEPFKEMMETIPEDQLDAVFQGEFTVLVFTDAAFFISEPQEAQLREYYRKHRKLPYKVQAVRFIPADKISKTAY
jgi:hypothetical protein